MGLSVVVGSGWALPGAGEWANPAHEWSIVTTDSLAGKSLPVQDLRRVLVTAGHDTIGKRTNRSNASQPTSVAGRTRPSRLSPTRPVTAPVASSTNAKRGSP